MSFRFADSEPTYVRIARQIGDGILAGKWKEHDRIPSIRELAVNLQVNPLTVMRAYEWLEKEGIIEARPGKGYFVKPGGSHRWRTLRLKRFLEKELPALVETMQLLNISTHQLIEHIHKIQQQQQHPNDPHHDPATN